MRRNVLNQPLPQQHGPKPFAQNNPTANGLISNEIIDAYHQARVELDEFCAQTDANRAKFNANHETARQRVFSFVNGNLIHEATVFEVVIPEVVNNTDPKLSKPAYSVFYLVEPRNTEIKRVDFKRAPSLEARD